MSQILGLLWTSVSQILDLRASGVDLLSVGWLTHSAPVLDVGLDFEV